MVQRRELAGEGHMKSKEEIEHKQNKKIVLLEIDYWHMQNSKESFQDCLREVSL